MITSQFLSLHQTLVSNLSSEYPEYFVADNEIKLEQGTFPAIGIFLGFSEKEKGCRTYTPISFTYVLATFDTIEVDDGVGFMQKQQETFELIEKIIQEQKYDVISEIEPSISIGLGEGSFISGWSTTIRFKAK